MEAKVYRFCASALGGLEEVVADELRGRLAELGPLRIERGGRQGRVFFTHRRSPRLLLGLQTPLSVWGVLAQVQGVTVGRPGLARLLGQLDEVDLAAARRLLKACEPGADEGRFQLSVTLRGAHRFSRGELARQVQERLRARGLAPGEGRNLLRLQLKVEGSRALLGLQLGPNRADQCLGPGGIGGPLASCLGRLLPAAGTEVLLALGCSPEGARALAATGDRGPLVAVVPAAAEGRGAGIVKGRAGALPLGGGCVDLAVAAGLGTPVRPWLGELARVLHPGGVALVLGSRALAAVLEAEEGFAIHAALPINLKGRRHTAWMLERMEAPQALLQIAGPGAEG
jgi:hypothetical protein